MAWVTFCYYYNRPEKEMKSCDFLAFKKFETFLYVSNLRCGQVSRAKQAR